MLRLILFFSLLTTIVLPASSQAATRTGAEVLAQQQFQALRGKRFGLITNRSAQVGGVHLIELLERAGVPPAVIFTPEHGLDESAEDGVKLSDGVRDGIPVKSLYGGNLKPRAADLEGLDLLLFDIQDIGVRFYTYISTMGLAMQAAAEAEIPFVVLDRPNPLGGNYVAGFTRTTLPQSFTSLYRIPAAHGLTVGELAAMVMGEAMLPGLEHLNLQVVRMQGWERWMRWPDTGLSFVPTSPNIADFETALMYAGTGIVESSGASEGRGTAEPFRLLGCPGIDADHLAHELNRQGLRGLKFEPVHFTPQKVPGKCSDPKFKGKLVSGVRIEITDYRSVDPLEAGVAVLSELYAALPAERKSHFFQGGFDDMAGSTDLRAAVAEGESGEEIAARWSEEIDAFTKKREPYLLYGNLSTTGTDEEQTGEEQTGDDTEDDPAGK